MTILLTNDDGYFAPGLAALLGVAERLGEVWVVAPETEQSYMGHRVTTGEALRASEYAARRFHVNGTPADCVRIAVRALGLRPDLVLSGINRGGNLGVDVYTSGTVAAAREAAIWGIPSAALSQYVVAKRELVWERSAKLAETAVRELLQHSSEAGTYWNVNFPHLEEDEADVRICELDPSPQDVHYAEEGDGFRFAGRYAQRPAYPGRDVAECFGGAITLSRLKL
jgi:5'-nucleotidase